LFPPFFSALGLLNQQWAVVVPAISKMASDQIGEPDQTPLSRVPGGNTGTKGHIIG
jgi:hypothetical protein